MLARRVINEISRYKDPAIAPHFKKHLISLADEALNDGFGPEAIVYYAEQVISGRSFGPQLHCPEFREALRRLRRDVERHSTCRVCANVPGHCTCHWPAPEDVPPPTAAELQRINELRDAPPRTSTAAPDFAATGTET